MLGLNCYKIVQKKILVSPNATEKKWCSIRLFIFQNCISFRKSSKEKKQRTGTKNKRIWEKKNKQITIW